MKHKHKHKHKEDRLLGTHDNLSGSFAGKATGFSSHILSEPAEQSRQRALLWVRRTSIRRKQKHQHSEAATKRPRTIPSVDTLAHEPVTDVSIWTSYDKGWFWAVKACRFPSKRQFPAMVGTGQKDQRAWTYSAKEPSKRQVTVMSASKSRSYEGFGNA